MTQAKKKATRKAPSRKSGHHRQPSRKTDGPWGWLQNHMMLLPLVLALFTLAAGIWSASARFTRVENSLQTLIQKHSDDSGRLGTEHGEDIHGLSEEVTALREDVNVGFAEIRTAIRTAQMDFGSRVERVEDKTEELNAKAAALDERTKK